tara:strand:- start:1800 stop:2300 length:501 start_codon:yes stop_codon:yes gene_type:complete
MEKNDDGMYVLKGTLDSVSGSVIRNGLSHRFEYIEIDGVRWGKITALGHIGSALRNAVGKKIELHFVSLKERAIAGMQVEGDSRFDTVEPSAIRSLLVIRYLFSFGLPLLFLAVFLMFKSRGWPDLETFMWLAVWIVGGWLLGYVASGGKNISRLVRYVKKYNITI